jgi:hypothetical protein
MPHARQPGTFLAQCETRRLADPTPQAEAFLAMLGRMPGFPDFQTEFIRWAEGFLTPKPGDDRARGAPTDGEGGAMTRRRDNNETTLKMVRRMPRILLRFRLRWHERAIGRPFTAEANDRLDAALAAWASAR